MLGEVIDKKEVSFFGSRYLKYKTENNQQEMSHIPKLMEVS